MRIRGTAQVPFSKDGTVRLDEDGVIDDIGGVPKVEEGANERLRVIGRRKKGAGFLIQAKHFRDRDVCRPRGTDILLFHERVAEWLTRQQLTGLTLIEYGELT